jgi:DNA mismatch endonuclease, patch repair protein
VDRISKQHRSWNMSRIKSRNTSPELIVRSLIHRLGYRFRLHSKKLPGKPDIVLSRLKTVIFVHGCFWHRHKNCRLCYTPKTRRSFWLPKFESNVVRDAEKARQLRKLGWRVRIIWECQTTSETQLQRRVERLLKTA